MRKPAGRLFVNIGALCLLALAVSGCSTETVRRTTYETLQNVREQECLKNPSQDCGERESYEGYQRKRKQLGLPQ